MSAEKRPDQPTERNGSNLGPVENPYVGPRPFADTERERRLFFGRERESKDLLSHVMSERVMLFYAPSGAGKSSLLHARLIPLLRAEGFDVLPKARVGGQMIADAEIRAFDNIYLSNLLRDLGQDQSIGAEPNALTLSAYLHDRPTPANAVGRVLIIDQFEEIVTTYPEQWSKRAEFFRQLAQAINENPRLWVVLTMREDYIAALDPYLRQLPGRLRTRYRMSHMPHPAAQQAIEEPAQMAGRPFAAGVAGILVDKLRQLESDEEDSEPQYGEFVEPLQLQVVCYQLWESLREQPGTEITTANLEHLAHGAGLDSFINNALAGFYEQTISLVLGEHRELVNERVLRDWFSHALITRDGVRNLVYQSDEDTSGLPNPVALDLEQRFLLRAEIRGGNKYVEIVHDRFVAPILDANRAWLEQTPLILAATRWKESQDARLLYSGAQLVDAEKQLDEHPERFGSDERMYVAASKEAAEAETRRRQALVEEQHREMKRLRRRAMLSAGFAVGLSLMLMGMVWAALQIQKNAEIARSAEATAVYQSEQAEVAKAAAEAALGETQKVQRSLRANQLANSAQLALASSPQLALLLAVEGVNVQASSGEQPSIEAVQGLRNVLAHIGGIPIVGSPANMTAVALSSDSLWLAVANELGEVRLWHTDRHDAPPVLLSGHSGAVWALRFIDDGARLVSAGDDGIVRIWRVDEPGAVPVQLAGHTGPVYAVAASAAEVASAGADTQIRLWSLADLLAPPLVLKGHEGAVNSLAFSPDGAHLVSGSSDATARLWPRGPDGAAPVLLSGPSDQVNSVTFSRNGAWLAAGGAGGQVYLWKLDGPSTPIALSGAADRISSVAFSPDNEWLASADDGGVIRMWSVQNPDSYKILTGHKGPVSGLAFVPTALGPRLVSSGYDGVVRIWNYDTLIPDAMILRGHDKIIHLLTTASSNGRFVTASDDRTIRIWDADIPVAEPMVMHYTMPRRVGDLAISPDGKHMVWAAVLDEPFVQVVDIEASQPLYALKGLSNSVSALAIAPDGAVLATGDRVGSVQLWKMADGVLQRTAPESRAVNGVTFSPDGAILAMAAQDGTALLWELATDQVVELPQGEQTAGLAERSSALTGVAFSEDGKMIAAADQSGMVHLWNAAMREWERSLHITETEALGALRGILSVAFHPSGRFLAGASEDGIVWLWVLTAADQPPIPLRGHHNEVNSVSFSPDGLLLASAGADGQVYLWNIATRERTTLEGHMDSVTGLGFIPDGQWLFTGSGDHTIRKWSIATQHLILQACRMAGRNLTPQEWEINFPGHNYHFTCPEY